jgi:hypothetical protein
MGLLQAVGVVMLLFLVATPIIPACYLADLVTGDGSVEDFALNGPFVEWLWFPLTVPSWMFSLSLMVVIAKWTVVGRYREQEMPIPSIAYMRWWWMDRALHLWEFWVGKFVIDTPNDGSGGPSVRCENVGL